MAERRGRLFLRGRLLVTTTRQPEGAPLLDGGSTRTAEGADYGSLVIRRRRTGEAWVIGWRGARVPWPGRWLPKALWRRWRGHRGPVVAGGTDHAVVREDHNDD